VVAPEKVKRMGRRRRRKTVKRVVKVLPKVFLCIICGRRSVSVNIDRNKGVATVVCSSCGARGEVEVKPYMTIVDAYSAWADLIYSGKLSIEGVGKV
jgi:transcription elongation factor Elf1